MRPLLERLTHGPLLTDGAMGTMLHASGARINTTFDPLNLDDPERVLAVHRAYIEAGADIIETNTFSANRFKLAEMGGELLVRPLNEAGVALARQAITAARGGGGAREISILGAIGPLGVRIAPYGRVKRAQAYEAFQEQIQPLIESGVDGLIFETFTDLNELGQGIEAARAIFHHIGRTIPIIASMTFTRDDRTFFGESPADVANALAELGADIIGVNCSGGPSQITRIARLMHAAQPAKLISAMPNAGFPESLGGRVMYPATPEYFADYAAALRQIGVNIIGGCCGTTPAHIAAMRAAIDDPAHKPAQISVSEVRREEVQIALQDGPTELARKLAAGKFVTTVEMSPPRGFTAHKTIASAQFLKDSGIDTVDIADSPRARMRMSPWAICHLIQAQINMETILHFPTRGRNLLRVQGDLLAAHALGVRNIFVVMGDPTNIGDYPNAHDTYDVVPSGLIKLIKANLNTGVDQAGQSIGQPTNFLVGCALNLGAPDVDKECQTLFKKIECGADFALTQSLFEAKTAETFRKRYEALFGPLNLPLLAGILPLYSTRHATFLHNEVPGINIPENVMQRIADAGEDSARAGVQIAQELLSDMQGLVQGAYIIPPFNRFELAADIVEGLQVRP